MISEKQSIHVLVTGVVQGVFYRKSAQERALETGLVGWVRNRNDGRVECRAIGTETQLLDFLRWLGKGPVRARVDFVEITWHPLETMEWYPDREGTNSMEQLHQSFVVAQTV